MERIESGGIGVTERQWAAGAHVAALAAAFLTSWLVGVAGVAAALAVWMLVRERYPFAAAHAKEAVNFNLTMLIYAAVAVVIGIVLVGGTVLTLGIGALIAIPAGIVLVLAAAAIALMWLVCSILATIKAYDGQSYRYPLTIRLF